MTLRKLDAVVEEPGHVTFLLDLLDDQLDVKLLEISLHIGGRDRRTTILHAVQEGSRVDLEIAEIAVAQTGEIKIEIGDMVERKAVAERAQRIEAAKLGAGQALQLRLLDLEHETLGQAAILLEELNELGEEV